MEKKPSIRDIRTINNPIQNIQNLKNAKDDLPLLKPFLKQFGIEGDKIDLEMAKAESGDIDGAETDLVNYYDDEKVGWNIKNMKRVDAFSARWHLAQKARIDYREARYHACVPVVLALLDGIINEAHERGRGSKLGFFAENANLEAWNSISGHSKGLKALAGVFNKGRYKTTSDQITITYRNGILHGVDLGYDNKMVAAKLGRRCFPYAIGL